MNYYILSNSTDEKVVGCYPQTDGMSELYNFDAYNSVHKLTFREFPNCEPNLNYIRLAPQAIQTDLISTALFSVHGFLISNKLKLIFEQFKLVPHKYFTAPIVHRGTLYNNYHLMHLVWIDDTDYVDYLNSKFIVKQFSKNLGSISLQSHQDYIDKSKELGKLKMITHECLQLKKDIEYDMFTLPLNTEVFISEKLKEELNKSPLTGLQIVPASRILPPTDSN